MTTGELAAAIAGLGSLPPVERMRTTVTLIDAAKAALAAERAAALEEAVAGGMTVEEVAAELGTHSSKLYRLRQAHRSAGR